jgi:hypothetical protein
MASGYKFLDEYDARPATTPTETTLPNYASIENLIDESVAEDRHNVAASAKQSLATQPDTYVKARALGQQAGIPADVAERNLPEIEYRAKLDKLIQTMQTAPALGMLMQDPGYLKRTHDEIDRLAQIELQTRGFREASEFKRSKQDGLANEQFARSVERMRVTPPAEVGKLSVTDPRHSEDFLDSLRKGVLNVGVQGEVLATLIDRGLAAAGSLVLPTPESGQPVPGVDDLTMQTQSALRQAAEAFAKAPGDKRMEVAGKIFEAAYNEGRSFQGVGEAIGYLAENPSAVLNFMGEMGAAAAPGLAVGGAVTSPVRNRIMDSAMRQLFKSMASKAVTGAGVGFFANMLPTIGGEVGEGLDKYDGDIRQALDRATTKGLVEGGVNAVFGALPLPFAGKGVGARMGNVLAETTYQDTIP